MEYLYCLLLTGHSCLSSLLRDNAHQQDKHHLHMHMVEVWFTANVWSHLSVQDKYWWKDCKANSVGSIWKLGAAGIFFFFDLYCFEV